MTQPIVIENPVITSAFAEPERHFKFDDQGITKNIVKGRRASQHFIPIPAPRKKSAQLLIGVENVMEQAEPNKLVNDIRERVSRWRQADYRGVTPTTRKLLEHWKNPDRERRLFFCQIEALETLIYLTEVAPKTADVFLVNRLREENAAHNPGLFRMATKMATGSGKTVVMSMIVAWHTLNKAANRQSKRYNDRFLVVAPGLTIRDRLRVLKPNDPDNYYRALDLVPINLRPKLQTAQIIITNFHSFKLKESAAVSKVASLTKQVATERSDTNPFAETEAQMVNRVCREFSGRGNVIVLNDEAHHCYLPNPDKKAKAKKLKGDDLQEAKKNAEVASLWASGLKAVAKKLGVRAIYDVSATPFYLKGSGYAEGTLFPWVVSDFSLTEAIECGIVKVPRVPVDDDRMKGDLPTYRHIWPQVRDALPKKGRRSQESQTAFADNAFQVPRELEGALRSLYNDYEKRFAAWEADTDALAEGRTPPVFIVVCNNTTVSKLVYDFIAGRETGRVDEFDRPILTKGELPLFSNVDEQTGQWSARPKTLLIDSEQLDSGEGMSADFKQLVATEINEFKAEYRDRFPGSDSDKLDDSELLREVMNTVGKAGKLGERIRCVVSVSMLTEGWDANTVTHILGVRAFGSQLLCEQVVGRGLRRISYAIEPQTLNINGETVTFDGFSPEYAEVYGVPFAFIPTTKKNGKTPPTPPTTRVRALANREHLAITFPRVLGYRMESKETDLKPNFDTDCRYVLSTEKLPTKTEMASIIGSTEPHTLADLTGRREQEVAFLLAKLVLERYYRVDGTTRDKPEQLVQDTDVQAWLFPQVLTIAKDWLATCLKCEAGTYPQLLLMTEFAYNAADCIHRAIVKGDPDKFLKPILPPDNQTGGTYAVDFFTAKDTWATNVEYCHVSHVTLDSGWEGKMAQVLEGCDETIAYVKNQGLGFQIPYIHDGRQRQYVPDFLVRWNDEHSEPLNLIVEVSGNDPQGLKSIKTHYARNYWLPAVNRHGGFGRWGFVEISEPYDTDSQDLRDRIAGRIRLELGVRT